MEGKSAVRTLAWRLGLNLHCYVAPKQVCDSQPSSNPLILALFSFPPPHPLSAFHSFLPSPLFLPVHTICASHPFWPSPLFLYPHSLFAPDTSSPFAPFPSPHPVFAFHFSSSSPLLPVYFPPPSRPFYTPCTLAIFCPSLILHTTGLVWSRTSPFVVLRFPLFLSLTFCLTSALSFSPRFFPPQPILALTLLCFQVAVMQLAVSLLQAHKEAAEEGLPEGQGVDMGSLRQLKKLIKVNGEEWDRSIS